MEGSREGSSTASSLSAEDPKRSERRVLLPVTDDVGERSVRIASDLSAATDADLLLLDAAAGTVEWDHGDTDVESHLEGIEAGTFATTDDDAVVESDPVSTVVETVASHGVDLLVVDAEAGTSNRIRGPAARRMSEHVDCDSLVVSENNPPPSIASVLVPVADGTNARTAVDVAAAIARENDAWIELLHVVDDHGSRNDAHTIIERYREQVGDDVETQSWILENEDVADCIVEQSGHYDLTVLGGSHTSRLLTFVFSSVSKDVAERAEGTVLEVYRGANELFGE